MPSDDKRLIEDYLPIEAISAEASREKSVRKGHISTLHLWWARRPLVACRAAVYGALVPADRWVKDIELKAQPDDQEKAEKTKHGKKKGLNRKAAKEFVTKLCRYPKPKPIADKDIKIKRETEAAIVEAHRHILEAHAERLTAELVEAKKTGQQPVWVKEINFQAESVTYDDILCGRAPRPRVLDMFAGGGAIPLEALRLGCEAYALDLNPVAHIIELCTLVYPQKYGKPDASARGMTGPKNKTGETTWGGLAAEVRHWGNWVLDRVRKEIADLYPPFPDPQVWVKPPEIAFDHKTGQWRITKKGKLKRGMKLEKTTTAQIQPDLYEEDDESDDKEDLVSFELPPGFLMPVAYLWTRIVRCKKPSCGTAVPMAKQSWLCQKKGRYVALKPTVRKGALRVEYTVCESESEEGLGFDPSGLSSAGNATCPKCGTVADSEYVKSQGCSRLMDIQFMGSAAIKAKTRGKRYFGSEFSPPPSTDVVEKRRLALRKIHGITAPTEPIVTDAKNSCWTHLYGLTTFGDLFTPRQSLSLESMVSNVRRAREEATTIGYQPEHVLAIVTLLACIVDKEADFNSSLCVLKTGGGRGIVHAFGRQAIPMVWDFAEANPFNPIIASWHSSQEEVITNLEQLGLHGICPADVRRGSALALPYANESMDSVITDPPYYDNVPYSNIGDYFYVWLKRSIGDLYSEHFATENAPKKGEAVADAVRHQGDRARANAAYEQMMLSAFSESARVLKKSGQLVVVYAHKTTLGWSTLVDALRRAGFFTTEAWPLDTETSGRLRAQHSAALASSIFLIARKREQDAGIGNYEDDVQPELQQIVRERVDTLWEMGVAGADLVIACVGAGLRSFTKYVKVEYANGEEVPAEKFLAEVEGVVLDTMMGKLFGQAGATVSAIDAASRFYILWRFVYKTTEIEAGEAIVFTYAQHVELDGPQGLSTGSDALVEKKKSNYRAKDFTERGDNDDLGLPKVNGQPAPLIDVLHRVLWLIENSPRKLGEFLIDAGVDRERLRILAQTLAGAALSGKSAEHGAQLVSTTPAEQASIGKLLTNWQGVIEGNMFTVNERADQKRGQKAMFTE